MKVCPHCYRLFGPQQRTCTADGTATVDHVQVLLGQMLGPYRVDSVIGEGGMGVVYKGEHPTIGRTVALKVLRPELSFRDVLVERFIQEARAVNTIEHANIVNIYDFGKTPFGSFYIVMEYLEGHTLRALLEQQGPQSLERARVVIRCIGAALDAAHSKGFVHRDVKPENIMLQSRMEREYAKLLDFGIVKLLSTQSSHQTQMDMGPLGTPQYMAPEQLEMEQVDSRTDVYALAAVVYEMLCGHPPFPGKDALQVRQLQQNRAPAPPSALRQDLALSPQMDAALLWGLRLDRQARCPRVMDLLTGFDEGYRTTLEGQGSLGVQPGRTGRRRVLFLGVGLAVLLVGLTVLLVLLWGGPEPDPGSASRDVGAPVLHPRPPAPPPPLEQARSRVLEGMRSPDAQTRVQLLERLAELGQPMLIPQVIEALDDEDLNVRRVAATTLGRMKDPQALPVLRKMLKESVGFLAVDVAEAMARLGDAEARNYLGQALRQARDEIRRVYILHALGRLGDRRALEWRSVLERKALMDAGMRIKALVYLVRLGDRNALQELREAARTSAFALRVQAAEALMMHDRELARRVLDEALELAPPEERVRAAMVKTNFGDISAARHLIDSLAKPGSGSSPKLRGSCALALATIPGDAVTAALAQALGDPEREVVISAALALLRRGGPELPH